MPDAKGRELPNPDTLPAGNDPIVAWATVIKQKSEDGLITVAQEYMGSRIAIDLRTYKYAVVYNKEVKRQHMREIVYKVGSEDEWLPIEILDIDI